MRLLFGGQDLVLHHSGALLWPARHLAVIADMHLEKGAYHATRGFYMPPYDSAAILARLLDVLEAANIRQLILLGDSFHDADGFARMEENARRLFNRLHIYNPIWIKGNYDGEYVPPGGIAYGAFESQGLTFCHEAGEHPEHEISAHYHPKATIVLKDRRVSRPCFVEDGNRLMLPAFGAQRGGLSVQAPAVRRLFRDDFRFHLLGDGRLHSFSNHARVAAS